ncbi:MAG: SH3 domain-containing protein [Chloroflexi bacterium]|nr:SH3 domain-containing protein [Chloroflexota bacterium]
MFRRITLLIFALTVTLTAAGVSVFPTYAQTYCMSVTSRLAIGAHGVVTPGLPNVLRDQPVPGGGAILAYIPAGGVFTVVDGPECNNGITWWQVDYDGIVGWTPEGQWSTYWTEPAVNSEATASPAASVPTTPTQCTLAPRLTINDPAQVTPGLPNRVRVAPTFAARVLGLIPGGGVFTVLTEGVCADSVYWYQVDYNGLIGWTAEGRNTTYWLAPQG